MNKDIENGIKATLPSLNRPISQLNATVNNKYLNDNSFQDIHEKLIP